MTKSLLLTSALLSILAVAAAGCAHQPPARSAALSAQLNVMQVANELGYTIPRVVNGKTLYCQPEELTGSLVPKLACIDGDQVLAQARSQGDEIKYMLKPPNAVQRPGG
jgi:hypothetical protein